MYIHLDWGSILCTQYIPQTFNKYDVQKTDVTIQIDQNTCYLDVGIAIPLQTSTAQCKRYNGHKS